MKTTTPPGHVHEDFSTVIAEVKPAPAGRQKKTSTPLYRQEPPRLLASVALFTLSCPLQISTRQWWPHSLSLCSPLVTDPAGSSPLGKLRRCNVHAVVLGDGSYPLPAHPDQRALSFSPKHRWLGRASNPFFLAAVVWADPASRRPPSDIPTTLRYNFLRNRPCSTSRDPDIVAFVSFTISQPPTCR